jgi:hypothetical protein
MRVTIINLDNSVAINGKTYKDLDFTGFPDNIHAIQWYSTYGEIEYVVGDDGVKPPNQKIQSLEPYQNVLDKWEEAEQLELENIANLTPTKEQIITGKRNTLLLASDWTQLEDVALTPEKKEEWAAYRQALRDFTSQPGFPDIDLPTKPSK